LLGNADGTFGAKPGNVYFDTSSSNRIHSIDIQRAIDTFGYEHIVLGSDTPYTGMDAQIEKIERLSVPDHIKEHIYSLNAKRILSI
jgi:predicted TIM-barrel fold metal-dependent hydrolase